MRSSMEEPWCCLRGCGYMVDLGETELVQGVLELLAQGRGRGEVIFRARRVPSKQCNTRALLVFDEKGQKHTWGRQLAQGSIRATSSSSWVQSS
jgi:hypothetical protein